MGKLLTVLTVIWLIGLLVCAQRFVHWSGKAEDGLLDYYDQDPEHREWTGDDFLAQQDSQIISIAWFVRIENINLFCLAR